MFGYKNVCRRVTPDGLTDGFGSVIDCVNPHNGSAGTIPLDQLGPWDIDEDFVPDGDVGEDTATLHLNWSLDGVDIKSITGFTDFNNLIGFDFDYSRAPHTRGWFDEELESWSQEFQISSNGDGPFQWTTGAYYSEDETYFSFTIFEFAGGLCNVSAIE